MKTILCSLILVAFNGAYLFICYNMELMVLSESEDKIEEVVTISTQAQDFEPSDLLDLDIFDIDVDELIERGNNDAAIVRRGAHLVHDRV
jgi:hypothetical protein